jgi:hypothetical protein
MYGHQDFYGIKTAVDKKKEKWHLTILGHIALNQTIRFCRA